MRKTELYVVRHGQTIVNVKGLINARNIIGINKTGKQEAKNAGMTQQADQAKKAQKELKSLLKKSAANVHPNICDFDHLDITDPGSKEYDIALCRAIPRILMMVDGYGMCKYQPKK